MLHLESRPPVHYYALPGHEAVNRRLLAGLQRELDGPHMRQSHYELGRYENTYIQRQAIPEIEPLCETVMAAGEAILGAGPLRLGFWFNIMQPGNRTARHNHEEENEQLSCVYYLCAPRNRGDLVLYPPREKLSIAPVEGRFVFFSPRLAHAVTENRSDRPRISVAFNLGRAESS